MDAELLLLELADLPIDARMKRAYQLGRDANAEPVLQRWENGNGFERRLALQSCYGSRDGARVVRMASDQSRLVRNLALCLAAEVCDETQLTQIFEPLDERARRRLIVLLLKKRRRVAVDALIESLRARGEAWQPLLYLGSSGLIERYFDEAFADANALDWSRLARSHPGWALEKLSARARELNAPDDALRLNVNAALSVAAPLAPDAALRLIRLMIAHEPLARLEVAALLSYRPLEVAQLVLGNDETPESRAPVKAEWGWMHTPSRGLDFTRVAPQLPLQILLDLARRRPETLSGLERELKPLAPDVRGQLFAEVGRSWRDDDGVIESHIVRLLPPPYRETEARRNLKLPSLAASPVQWLPYVALLPFDEMRERIEPFIGDPDPDLRAAAIKTLIGGLRFHFGRTGDVLKMLEARRNESDPIRAAIFTALHQLPPSRWSEVQLDTLARLIQFGLDARDLSATTTGAMQLLVVGILPFHPAWAAQQLAIVVSKAGNLSVYGLQDRLSDAQMPTVGAALLPVLRGWLQREGQTFISAFTLLGRRLEHFDEGAALIRQAVESGPTNLASSAAALLYQYRRDEFGALVPQLLKTDKSWGTQAPVYHYVHFNAPNLLTTPMLGRDSIKGKFWTGQTRFVLPIARGFAHWTPDQQQLFARTQSEIIADSERDLPSAIQAIKVLAALPDIAPDALIQLASLDNERLALREAALRELCWLDAGGGVPTLIEALDDERARIAIYGLRRALLQMPAARALEILRDVPMEKVTVAKEVVRLLGDLGDDEAFEFLLELSKRDLHRDVRVALCRALWEHLDDARSWPILREATTSNQVAIAQMAARTTAPRLGAAAKSRLAALLAGLLGYPEARVRLEVLANPSLPLLGASGELREALFGALASELPGEYRLAALAICQSAAVRDATLAARAIAQLLGRRRALSEVLVTLSYQITSRRHFADVTRAILDELGRDPLTFGAAIPFAYAGLSESDWADWIEGGLQSGALHADALHAASEVLSDEYNPARANRAVGSDETLLRRWRASESPELRRLALADLVGAAQSGDGWSDERLQTLEQFRQDESLLVAAAAQWTFPGDEADDDELDALDLELPGQSH